MKTWGPLALFVLFALAGLGCDVGARTGLTIPEFRRDGGLDAPRDVGTDAPDAPPVCMPGMFPLVPTSADVVFTIDRSGSMRLTIDGIEDAPRELWRWTLLRDSLAEAFADLDPRVNVGAEFYPIVLDPTRPEIPPEEACSTSPGIDVPVSPDGRARILEIFRTTDAIGGTPTAMALAEASNALLRSTSSRRFIVLATDGGPNCNGGLSFPCVCTSSGGECSFPEGHWSCLDDTRTIDTIRGAVAAGAPVYVIGIEDPTRPDLGDVMDAMAIAGGRPRVGARRSFYSVRTAAELREALDSITATISACGFVSPSVPVDESTFSLTIDGAVVPRSDTDGWRWTDRAFGEVELSGSWCDRARLPGADVVAIVDDCP